MRGLELRSDGYGGAKDASGSYLLSLLFVSGVALFLGGCQEAPSASRPPNIFLLTIESLRPDHLGFYTGLRPTSPNLDALAEQSVVFEDAHSVTSWTLASHASIFSGLYPSAHGAVGARSRLDDGVVTLAEILSEAGYQTAGFATGPYLGRRHNLNKGFEHYDDSVATVGLSGGAHDDVTTPLLEPLVSKFLSSSRDRKRPLFFFAYLWDPHYDYIPPPPFDTMFVDSEAEQISVSRYESSNIVDAGISDAELRYVESQYDGEIRFTDEYLGRFFDLLRNQGLWEDSLIVITADHGEEFFDHGQKGHKRTLYVESVHVPLLIKFPKSVRTGRDDRLVSLVDLFPTILEAAGIESDAIHQGVSLLKTDPETDRSIFFELLSTFYHRRGGGQEIEKEEHEWWGVRQGDDKLLLLPSENRVELYRTRLDPTEQLNVAIENSELVALLKGKIDDWKRESRSLGGTRQPIEADLDQDQLERLRALGYIGQESTPVLTNSPVGEEINPGGD